MIRRFFKDSAIYTFGTIVTRGIQIIMVPIYTRLLTPSDYGIMDMLMVVASFANVTVALEIGQGFARYYSDATELKDKIEYSSTTFWFVVLMYSIFLFISFAFARNLNSIIVGKSSNLVIFQIAMIAIWGGGIFNFLRNQLKWYLKSKYFAISSIIYTAIAYSITIVLMVIFHLGVIGVFWGMVVGYIAGNLASWYFSKSNYKLTFNFSKFKEMLHFSLPLVPSSVGSILLLYIDRIAIKDLMKLSDVGIFGVGYRFAAIISIVLAGFQTALVPLIYQNYKKSETPNEIAKIFYYFLIIVLGFILLLSLFSHELLVIFATPAYYEAAKIIPIISFSTLFLSLYIFTVGLSLAKKTKLIAAINILAAILNTALNFSLIPLFGIIGASISTLISGIVLFVLNMYFSQKYFYVPYNWYKIISVFLITTGIIYLSILMESFVGINLYIMIVIKIFIFIIIGWSIIRTLVGKQKFLFLVQEIKQSMKNYTKEKLK